MVFRRVVKRLKKSRKYVKKDGKDSSNSRLSTGESATDSCVSVDEFILHEQDCDLKCHGQSGESKLLAIPENSIDAYEDETKLGRKSAYSFSLSASAFQFFMVYILAQILQRKLLLYAGIPLILSRCEAISYLLYWVKFIRRHYFWGSRSACQIYLFCMFTLALKPHFILHGILSLLVSKVLMQILLWGLCFTGSRDFRQLENSISYLNAYLNHMRSKVTSERVLTQLAGLALRVWQKKGKQIVSSFLRSQMSELNDANVTGMRQSLSRDQELFKRSSRHLNFSLRK